MENNLIPVNPADVLVVEGRNTRFDYALDDLKASIRVNGVKSPIKLRSNGKGKLELVDGHRRIEACRELLEEYQQLEQEPPKVDGRDVCMPLAMMLPEGMGEQEVMVEMLVSNDGKPLLPMEEAMLLKRLKDTGISAAEVARRVGKSVAHVTNRLSLLGADQAVKDAVEAKEITLTDAVEISRAAPNNPERQRELVEEVREKGKTEVIERGLKKGRIPGHQMKAVQQMFDHFYAAWMDPENPHREQGEGKFDNKALQRVRKYMNDVPEYEFIYQLGQLAGAAELHGLELEELLTRVSHLTTGVVEAYYAETEEVDNE